MKLLFTTATLLLICFSVPSVQSEQTSIAECLDPPQRDWLRQLPPRPPPTPKSMTFQPIALKTTLGRGSKLGRFQSTLLQLNQRGHYTLIVICRVERISSGQRVVLQLSNDQTFGTAFIIEHELTIRAPHLQLQVVWPNYHLYPGTKISLHFVPKEADGRSQADNDNTIDIYTNIFLNATAT